MKFVEVQLVVPARADPRAVEAAKMWFNRGLSTFGERFHARLSRGTPDQFAKTSGRPGELRATLSIRRNAADTEEELLSGYSPTNLNTLTHTFDKLPPSASFEIGTYDDLGRVGRPILWLSLTTIRAADQVNLLLTATTDDQATFEAHPGQATAVGFLRTVADGCNPNHGEIAYRSLGDAALSYHLYGSLEDSVIQSRTRLRSYGWVTVMGQTHCEALGGITTLQRSGSFVRVTPLTAGGVLAQATHDWKAYDLAAANRVFQTLAPVLPSGRPRPRASGNHIVERDPRDIAPLAL